VAVLGELNEGQREFLAIADAGGQTLLGMINDLLDISKLESGLLELDYAELDPTALVGEALAAVAQLAAAKSLTLLALIAPDLQSLHGDWEKLRRVLVNRFLSQARRRWNNEVPSDPVQNDWDQRAVADFAGEVQTREAVLSALNGLTVRERAVVALRYSQDLSEAETAELLGMATGTVKSTASRALAKLRLAPDLIDSGVGGN